MSKKQLRAAIYLRVSTDQQTVENQRRELTQAAEVRDWLVVAEYADEGISGAKGRDLRPRLDAMLQDAIRGKFGVAMAWSVDRLGRSLPDLVAMMQELHGAKVDLFLHQQALDTSTPAGRAMFGMLGVFADFERSMIQARVIAGLARAKAAGVKLGRKRITPEREEGIRDALEGGTGIVSTARLVGCGVSVVQRVRDEMRAERKRH